MDVLFLVLPFLLVAGAYLKPAEEQVNEPTLRYGESRPAGCACTAGC